jgi:hypothetical protein
VAANNGGKTMRRKLLAMAAALGLLLAACEAEINVRVELEADGSGTAAIEIGVDEEFRELIEASGESLEDALLEGGDEIFSLPGAEQVTFTRGDLDYIAVSLPFDDINDLSSLAEDASDNPLNDLDISIDEDRAVVTGSLDLGDDTLGAADLGEFDPGIIEDVFAFHIQVKMPGDVKESDADRTLEDGTLEWDIPLTGGVVTIEAVSDPNPSSGIPIWLIALIALAVVVVILLLIWAIRSNRGKATTDEAVLVGAPDGPSDIAAAPEAPEAPEGVGETAPAPETPNVGDVVADEPPPPAHEPDNHDDPDV